MRPQGLVRPVQGEQAPHQEDQLAHVERPVVNTQPLGEIALEIKEVYDLGIQLALVIGGGNMMRGSEYEERGMDRSTADQMGMRTWLTA